MDDLFKCITEKGVIIPDTEEIKQAVQEEFKRALGNDLDLSDSTPQGRLIDTETLSRANTLRAIATIANCFNPNTSYGKFLDALSALTACKRKEHTQSRVTAILTGEVGTEIPAGVLAETLTGDKFYLENAVTIGIDGQASGIFLAEEYGAIPCPAESLTTLKTTIEGLEGIINPTAAVLGEDTESDAALKKRRLETLYQGRSFLGDVQSALANVPNIQSYFVTHNYRNKEMTTRGVTIKPHSLYACVYGGTDEDVAWALYRTNCADYSGSQSVMVTDPWINREYEVNFERATEVNISVRVYIQVDSGQGDVGAAIKSAIMDYQNGVVENVDGLNIGVNVSPFEMASAINIVVPGVYIKQVQIAKNGKSFSTNVIEINWNEIARINEGDISIRYN